MDGIWELIVDGFKMPGCFGIECMYSKIVGINLF
jgi:hypothetical protein